MVFRSVLMFAMFIGCSQPASVPVLRTSAGSVQQPLPSTSASASASALVAVAPLVASASSSSEAPRARRIVIYDDSHVKPIIHFEHRQAKIKKENLVILETVLEVLTDHPEIRVEIQGHIDASEKQYLQRTYGHDRAEVVRKWLISRGIEPQRIETKDYGESRPLVIPKTEEDKAQNRRVEFKSIPPTQ